MIVFFSIPVWLIAFFVLGAIAIATTLMSYIIFFVYMVIGVIPWFFHFGFLREKRIEEGNDSQIGLIFIFVIGLLSTTLCAYIFSRTGARLSGFILVMLFDAIICSISYVLALTMSSRLRLLSSLILILGAVLTAIWSIGYDISYTLKSDYRNIAYFECTKIRSQGWGSTGKIYDSLKSNRVAIGSFEVGDVFYPCPDLIQGIKYHNDNLWPINYNGITAYVPSVNFEPRYWRESKFIQEQWSSIIGWKKYRFLPDPFLHSCEYLFDHFPFGVSFVLVSS